MQAFAVVLRCGARGVELMLRTRYPVVRLGHRGFGGGETRIRGRELAYPRLQVELPRVHLRGELAICLLDLGQFRVQRREPAVCRIALFGETLFPVKGDLQPRLRLRKRHLAVTPAVA